MSISDEFHKTIERLERERDELRVKLNLASHEVRDEWEELERTLGKARGKLDAISKEASEAGSDARAALELALDDLKRHLQRLRERL
ncbi:MAG: HPF/RaiA family ribosome-associated protein [Myxococcota bacterium]|nr:HPF/RaiA family ribosome-associated protein [Myxococcota bacterium]